MRSHSLLMVSVEFRSEKLLKRYRKFSISDFTNLGSCPTGSAKNVDKYLYKPGVSLTKATCEVACYEK